jgi:hypothetical protein
VGVALVAADRQTDSREVSACFVVVRTMERNKTGRRRIGWRVRTQRKIAG